MMFGKKIGETIKEYVDDMDYIAYLDEAFSIMRRYGMILNPTKCVFRVGAGKFLGFMFIKGG